MIARTQLIEICFDNALFVFVNVDRFAAIALAVKLLFSQLKIVPLIAAPILPTRGTTLAAIFHEIVNRIALHVRHAPGQSVGALCEGIHKARKEGGVRQIQGVLSLVKRHGNVPIDEACALALEAGAGTYRLVKKWIDRNPPAPPLALRQVDPLIRELSLYRELIDSMTGTEKK